MTYRTTHTIMLIFWFLLPAISYSQNTPEFHGNSTPFNQETDNREKKTGKLANNDSPAVKLIFHSPQLVSPDKFIPSFNRKYFVLTDQVGPTDIAYGLFRSDNPGLIASGIISLPVEDDCFSVEIIGVSDTGDYLLVEKECKVFSDGSEKVIYDIEADRLIENIEIDWGESDRYSFYYSIDGPYGFTGYSETIDPPNPSYLLSVNKNKLIVSDYESEKIIWESPKQKTLYYVDYQLLSKSVVLLSTKGNVGKSEQFIWYDFIKKDTVYRTTNPFGIFDFGVYFFNPELTLYLNNYPYYKGDNSVATINMSTGVYTERRYVDKKAVSQKIKHLKERLAASKEANDPAYIDAHSSLYAIFLKYYNKDGSLKDKTNRGSIAKEFYPPDFWNPDLLTDSIAYNWYVFSATQNKVIFRDIKTTNSMGLFPGGNRPETNLMFWNGNLPEKDSRQVNMMYVVDKGPFFYTQDGYYMASHSLNGIVSFKYEGKIYPFEQFDLKFNRPDIILERLGYADSTLIAAYHQAYLKRLKKMGLTEDMLKDDARLLEIDIENFEYLPVLTDPAKLGLQGHQQEHKESQDYHLTRFGTPALNGSAANNQEALPKSR